MSRRAGAAAALTLSAALAVAVGLDRRSPQPSAAVPRGSEDAFASGLEPREFQPPARAPGRWTRGRAAFRFRHLPPGPARLSLRLNGHSSPIRISANGVDLGALRRGRERSRFDVAVPHGGELRVELAVDTFPASRGRRLGALLDHVTVEHSRRPLPSPALAALFVVPAAAVLLAALGSGAAPSAAGPLAAAVTLLQAALVWPQGLVRSGYLERLAASLVLTAALAWLFAWLLRRRPRSRPWAFAAALLAMAVQVIASTHPQMIAFDSVFHANRLVSVAAGELLQTSLTQHEPPIRFPYGFAFYGLLAPFVWAGAEPVAVVRAGAAACGAAGSLALYWLVGRERPRVALLAVLLQLAAPWTFLVFPNGNFSNVGGQAATAGLFCWWAGGLPGGWAVGAGLLAFAALSHLSSLILSAMLVAALWLFARRAGIPLGRIRWIAVGVGLGVAALYYVHFLELILGQLPRMLAGRGSGARELSLIASAGEQLREVAWGLGLPALALAVVGRPRPARSALDGALAAYWTAGLGLGAIAVLSPLEVRYVYALALPLGVAAAMGAATLWSGGGWRRATAALLVLAQVALAVREIVDAILFRYRL